LHKAVPLRFTLIARYLNAQSKEEYMEKSRRMIWILSFCFIPFVLYGQATPTLNISDTYFSYSLDELEAIRSLPIANEELNQQKCEALDSMIDELTAKPLPDGLATRCIAYLNVANRDFALLSYQIAQKFVGNVDLLTLKILQLINADFRPAHLIQVDPYSSKISEIVFSKIEERYKEEQAHLKDYSPKLGPNYWKEEPPYLGQRIGTCKLWLVPSLESVEVMPPPNFDSIIWSFGINQILFDQALMTPTMKKLVFYWGGQDGPKSGNWLAIANKYLEGKSLAFPDFLFIRATLAMGYVDALAAAFDAKYTYWVQRPHMRNSKVVQVINCPKHPSYPSAHSVTSAASATILIYFFPDEKEKWQKMVFEAASSRIWGGLHYMYDNEAGLIQGEKVGRMVIEHLANPPIQEALQSKK